MHLSSSNAAMAAVIASHFPVPYANVQELSKYAPELIKCCTGYSHLLLFCQVFHSMCLPGMLRLLLLCVIIIQIINEVICKAAAGLSAVHCVKDWTPGNGEYVCNC